MPNMSARSMTMVLTLGMSSPFSMMEVATSTSNSPPTKRCITSSSSRSSIWPWAKSMLASGSRRVREPRTSWIERTRLCR